MPRGVRLRIWTSVGLSLDQNFFRFLVSSPLLLGVFSKQSVLEKKYRGFLAKNERASPPDSR